MDPHGVRSCVVRDCGWDAENGSNDRNYREDVFAIENRSHQVLTSDDNENQWPKSVGSVTDRYREDDISVLICRR
jgi:hypothetical protein